MGHDLPSEVWRIILVALRVCAKKAPISELRKALKCAGYWPPSVVEKEIESKCVMSIESEPPTKE